jgi:hypothetical protein
MRVVCKASRLLWSGPNLIAETTIYAICCFKNVGVTGTPQWKLLQIICLHYPLNLMASYPVTFCALSQEAELMCSFIVVRGRSITKCDLINNIIKTILTRSIGLFLFFYEFMALFRCPFFFFPHNFVVLQFSKKKIFCKCVSLNYFLRFVCFAISL